MARDDEMTDKETRMFHANVASLITWKVKEQNPAVFFPGDISVHMYSCLQIYWT